MKSRIDRDITKADNSLDVIGRPSAQWRLLVAYQALLENVQGPHAWPDLRQTGRSP
jgi:hypothetical protein